MLINIPNKTAAKSNAQFFILLPPTWFRLKQQTVEEHHVSAKCDSFWLIGDMYMNTHELNLEEFHTACRPVYVQRWPLMKVKPWDTMIYCVLWLKLQ